MAIKKKIGIINYSIGNLYSIANAINFLGEDSILIDSPQELSNVSHLVLPGVGAFDKCYGELNKRGFIDPILKYIYSGKPLLGICVGMQLLFSTSEEGVGSNGLNLIKGIVKVIPRNLEKATYKVPHVAWEELIQNSQEHTLLTTIGANDRFYFVHSYNAHLLESEVKTAYTNYHGMMITALVEKNNIFGCQFHPEKSRNSGLKLLRNFINI